MCANDSQLNVLGEPLASCSIDPMTGWTRNGCCEGFGEDRGQHIVCAQVTAEFLDFSRAQGNDLITPRPEFGFPGLTPGDRWCLCLSRWLDALEAGHAPPIDLHATHKAALHHVELDVLKRHAIKA
ncbi:MAG: DUF2237 domain-containing protein [Alphaproteobacteria bacterium]